MARAWIAAGMVAALFGAALVAAPSGKGGAYDEYEELLIGTVIQRHLDPQEGRLMSGAGIGSVRFWMVWSAIESERDEYDWLATDQTIGAIASEGLTPAPFLFGTPAWVAKGDGFACDGSDCLPVAPATFESRSEFARFAGAAVSRYGPGGVFWEQHPGLPYRPIRVWQLWNEPNLQAFWRPYVDAIGYAELVRLAAEQIRAEDPGAEVLLAGLSGNRSTSTRWSAQTYLHHFYAVDGIAESFDGIAIHPYASRTRGVLDRIRNARAVAAAYDPGVDLWITEIGWASDGSQKWNLVKTIGGQARLLRRSFTRLIRRTEEWRLRGLYWYAWRDTEVGKAVCGWCGRAGLRDRKGRPKPAFYELRRLAGA